MRLIDRQLLQRKLVDEVIASVYRTEMAQGSISHSFIQEIQPAMNGINSFISNLHNIALPCKCFQRRSNAIPLLLGEWSLHRDKRARLWWLQNNVVTELSNVCVDGLQIGYFGCFFKEKESITRPIGLWPELCFTLYLHSDSINSTHTQDNVGMFNNCKHE